MTGIFKCAFASYNLSLYHSDNMLAAENGVGARRGFHHGPIEGQATSLGLVPIRDDSASIREDFDSHLSKKQSSGSITSEEPWPNNLVTLSVGDGIFSRKVAGQSPKRSRTELSGCYLDRSNHRLAKSSSVLPESENLGLDNDISESASDTEDGQDSGHRWAYQRIVALRIDSSGCRMAMVEWGNTWEPEDELDWLKEALRQYRYARERRERQDSEEAYPKCRPRKRKCSA